MKFKLAAVALFASVAMMCSESNGDLLSRMLGRGGCGGCQTSSCCDTPAPSCGGGLNLSINLSIGRPGRLFGGGLLSGGCGGSCGGGVVDSGCGGGCGAPVMDSGCGCGSGGGKIRGMLSGLFSGGGSCGAVDSCGGGCGAVESCGGGCGSKLFNGSLLGRLRGIGGNLGGGCGCDSGCGAPAVSSCGGGCSTPAPAISSCGGCGQAADSCGCGGGKVRGLLSSLRSRGGSCDGCGAPASDCGCSAPAPAPAPAPVASCGGCGQAADSCGCGGGKVRGLISGVRGRLSSIGGSCGGCGAPASDCGCSAPAPAPVASCGGCGQAADSCGCGGGKVRGLISGIRGRLSSIGGNCGSCGAPASDCGCSAPAPAPVASCGGCGQAADSCGCGGGKVRGLLSSLRSRGGSCGGCGAPASDCGCSAPAPAPVASCGGCGQAADSCGCGGGKVRGLISGVRGRVSGLRGGSCGGCGSSSCGGGCGESSCKLSLLDRLRGDRVARGPGCSSNDGCNSPCPNSGCSSCDSGAAFAEPAAQSCNSCGNGAVTYDAGSQAPVAQPTPSVIYESAPVAQPAVEAIVPAAEGSVITPSIEGASNATPVVDPSAFVIKKS